MPRYDYDCAACGLRFEVMHSVFVDGPTACPTCGSDRVRKAFAAPAIHFKGSGWAKKERRATASPGSRKTGSEDGGDAAASSNGASESSDGGAGGDTKDGGKTPAPSKDADHKGKGGSEPSSTPAKPAPTASGAD